jgi:hypothetical protein
MAVVTAGWCVCGGRARIAKETEGHRPVSAAGEGKHRARRECCAGGGGKGGANCQVGMGEGGGKGGDEGLGGLHAGSMHGQKTWQAACRW